MRWLFLAKNISDFVFTEIHKKIFKEKHKKKIHEKIFMKKMQTKRNADAIRGKA